MKTRLMTPNRLLVEFPSKKEMNLSMFRISEFFEGEKPFKGHSFTPDQFLERWMDANGELKKFGTGESYFAFWDGYNISANAVYEFPFHFHDVSARERAIIDAVRKSRIGRGGYLITCVKGDKGTLKHELAHAAFFEDAEYRAKASRIVASLPAKVRMRYKKHLRAMNYAEDVFTDEIQAYLVAYDAKEHREVFGSIGPGDTHRARSLLRRL